MTGVVEIDVTRTLRRPVTEIKKIVVVGTGYVGLPAAILLADAGHEVLGVDINESVVNSIRRREPLLDEEELSNLLKSDRVGRNLTASTQVETGDIFVIAVPTPLHPTKRIAALEALISAVESVLPHLRPGNLVIIESTIPPRTCQDLVKPMIEKGTKLRVPEDIKLAHCPERILPGNMYREIVRNDRIIGGIDEESSRLAKEMYEGFVIGDLVVTDDLTAELCKLMENTYRDVNIALTNEMSEVAETLGINYETALGLVNRHPRVSYLKPGIGVGGHCIPLDPWFIREIDPLNTRIIDVSRTINLGRPEKLAKKIRKKLANIGDPKILALGATYKPDVDDCRESPAVEIVDLMVEDGYKITHLDPMVPSMSYGSLIDEARGADLLVVLVPHQMVLREIERDRRAIEAVMRTPQIWIPFTY
jgi:UDP-N-acetyl-D-mannosaminuronic acid dehydrogenase